VEEPGTRIVAVSNRLPIRLVHGPDGLEIKPGEGGLVTALAPVFRNRGGVWIGWSGGTDDEDLAGLMEPASRETTMDSPMRLSGPCSMIYRLAVISDPGIGSSTSTSTANLLKLQQSTAVRPIIYGSMTTISCIWPSPLRSLEQKETQGFFSTFPFRLWTSL